MSCLRRALANLSRFFGGIMGNCETSCTQVLNVHHVQRGGRHPLRRIAVSPLALLVAVYILCKVVLAAVACSFVSADLAEHTARQGSPQPGNTKKHSVLVLFCSVLRRIENHTHCNAPIPLSVCSFQSNNLRPLQLRFSSYFAILHALSLKRNGLFVPVLAGGNR